MEAKATLRNLQIAPRKVRLVADLILGVSIEDARRQLMVSDKKAAKPMLILINSAAANAEQSSLDTSTLRIKSVMVGHGRTLKRFKPRAFGRATMIRKRASHIILTLDGEGTKKAPKKEGKKKGKPGKEVKAAKNDMEKQEPVKSGKPGEKVGHQPAPVDRTRLGHERPTQHKTDKKGITKI